MELTEILLIIGFYFKRLDCNNSKFLFTFFDTVLLENINSINRLLYAETATKIQAVSKNLQPVFINISLPLIIPNFRICKGNSRNIAFQNYKLKNIIACFIG